MSRPEQTVYLEQGGRLVLVKDELRATMEVVSKPLNQKELADHYGVNERTVRRWCETKKITHDKIGHVIRFDLAQVREDLAKYRIFPKKKPT